MKLFEDLPICQFENVPIESERTMKIEDNLTETTKKLLTSLEEKGVNVEFEVKNEFAARRGDFWGMISPSKIIAPNDKPNPAAFAHELLHIDLLSRGFATDKELEQKIETNQTDFHKSVFSCNNNLAHLKMITQFQELGFNKSEFLAESADVQLQNAKQPFDNESFKVMCLLCPYLKFEAFITGYSVLCLFQKHYNDEDSTELENKLKAVNKDWFQVCKESFEEWNSSPEVNNVLFFSNLKKQLIK
jgi:hypothetical protein